MTVTLAALMLVGAAIGAAAGYLGSFMVLKRMALVGDALSHVALPGIALALSFHLSPFIGAFTALTLAVIGIWYFESHSAVYPEALVGVFFALSLAIGVLLTPEPELLEALFGDLNKITFTEGLYTIVLSVTLIVMTQQISSKLLLSIISQELSTSMRINFKLVNLVYLLLVGGVVAVGVKFVGTLLMGALVIIPAVSAQNISKNHRAYTLLATFFGLGSAVTGIFLSSLFSISAGPVVVLASIFFFLITYFLKKIDRVCPILPMLSRVRIHKPFRLYLHPAHSHHSRFPRI